MKKSFLFVALTLGLALSSWAQNITVTSAVGQDIGTFLRRHLFDNAVTISNVKFNNVPDSIAHPQIGTFTSNGYTRLGMDGGIVMTTGHVAVAPGPNNQSLGSLGVPNIYQDTTMNVYTTSSIYSSAAIDLDFVSTQDSLVLHYVFASEEYPEYVCSANFYDLFAILLTGPDPVTHDTVTHNLSVIPGTASTQNPDGIWVSTSSVNPGVVGSGSGGSSNCYLSYSQYYVNNSQAGNPGVQYDGFTTKMTARSTIIPGATYHLHITVSNIGDNVGDSGVFFEGDPNDPCDTVANLSVDSIDCTHATITWQQPAIGNDSVYLVVVDGVTDTVIASTDSAFSRYIGNLLPNTLHTVAVGTLCNNGDTLWAHTQFMTPAIVYQVNVVSSDSTLGTVSGGGSYTQGSTATLSALPQVGTLFAGWAEDSVSNPVTGGNPLVLTVQSNRNMIALYSVCAEPRTDTLIVHDTVIRTDTLHVHDTLNIHDTLRIYDTILVHDTVFVTDTVFVEPQGIGEVETVDARIYQREGRVVIEMDEGQASSAVNVYDEVGRLVGTRHHQSGARTMYQFDVPATGVYIVKIGNKFLRRIVVVR